MKNILFILLAVGLFANEDFELLSLAYKNGLRPAPTGFESLLSELNTTSKELSKEKIILGKKLFFDKDLSLNTDISCATCHSFNKGGADAIPTAIGHKNQKNPFHLNTPTVLNTVFSKKFFWDGRSKTLQDQAKGPLQAPFEMSITPELAQQRVEDNWEYIRMFRDAYGSSEISFGKIADAISSYEKTLITRGRYDDFLVGYFDALSKTEKEGLELFIKKGCVGCHNGVGLGGEVSRKFPLVYHSVWSKVKPLEVKVLQEKYRIFLTTPHNIDFEDDESRLNYLKLKLGEKDTQLLKSGFFKQIRESEILQVMTTVGCNKCHEKNTYQVKKSVIKEVAFPFENRGGFLGSNNEKYFRVPLLRNVVRTKPYFHNGSIEKLEDAIKIMATHQVRVNLTDSDIEKIVEFLKAVDSEVVEYLE